MQPIDSGLKVATAAFAALNRSHFRLRHQAVFGWGQTLASSRRLVTTTPKGDPGSLVMGGWYRVVKTIKGHQYLYDQQTYREGGQVRTRNRYLGPAADESRKSSKLRQNPPVITTTPLFRDPADFGAAMLKQFDAQQWAKDTGQQLLGGKSQSPRSARRRSTGRGHAGSAARKEVTTTQDTKPDEQIPWPPHRRIADAFSKEYLGINMGLLEKQARGCGYNLWHALITRVDSQDDIRKKVVAIHAIMDEILNADPYNETSAHESSVTTTQASRRPASTGLPGQQASGADAPGTGHSPRDVQAEITNKIVDAIAAGQANGTFQMSWQALASEGSAVNAVTHQPYHGVNLLLLSFEAMQRKWPNQWASFHQWKERRANVRKGEHGTPIVFYTPIQIQEPEDDEEGNKTLVLKTIPVFRYSTVFNIAQVDNPPSVTTTPRVLVNPIEKVEHFINATKAEIRYGGNRAYYSSGMDYIQMPVRDAFTGSKTSTPTEAFYSTILHELCHWTGAKSRLSRETGKRFGDDAYAAEELIAEIGAAFTCAQLGITPELRKDHVQYVASWLKILKEDKRAIFTASAAAARAVEYLETLQPQE
jgi:antirestriction protein ArdC